MQNPFKILFKYTSRGRVARFFKGLASIYDNLANKDDFYVVCTFDENDKDYNTPVFTDRLKSFKNLTYFFGVNNSKISAINRDADKFPEDYDVIVNMSDDMVFLRCGFDDTIRKAFEESQHGLDTWVHFMDGAQNRLSTMSIIGRAYYERTNYIYHPDFISVFCDNCEQEKAQKLGRYIYMGDDVKIFRHEHPYHGFPQYNDKSYRYTESFYAQDQATFARHKKHNFYIK